MYFNFCIFIFTITFSNYVSSTTTCEESQKQFADLCFSPTPTNTLDFEWSAKSQPEDGWHVITGNDIVRLHFAESLRGELLNFTDNFEHMCFRGGIDQAAETEHIADGKFWGFGNLTSKWYCNASNDFPGVLLCDTSSSGPSKYHEFFHVYISYTDNKNVQLSVYCFPNGQVGWTAAAISKTLTKEEKKGISDHVTSLGFSNANTVELYDEACSNETK